jgi:uncharacterized membrane protein YhaH (DUF805 family)
LASITASVAGVLGILFLVYAAFAVLCIVATVKIITKAGYSGWWILTGIVPVVGIVMFFVFAFSEWPVLRRGRSAPPDPSWPPPPPEYGGR